MGGSVTTIVGGLTGGIGSGKSVASGMLADRGAVVIDADEVARQALGPGGSARQAVVSRFGSGILGPDGEIDRPALAAIVFADAGALNDLNSLTHPVVRKAMLSRLAVEADRGSPVVILDIPLLVEGGRDLWPLDGVIVVDAPVGVATRRLMYDRGMTEAHVRARMAAQVGRVERLAAADFVIDNSAGLGHLEVEVGRAWAWLTHLGAGADRVSI